MVLVLRLGLSQVYHGGIGSFRLYIMVSHLFGKAFAPKTDKFLSDALLHFLTYYTTRLVGDTMTALGHLVTLMASLGHLVTRMTSLGRLFKKVVTCHGKLFMV